MYYLKEERKKENSKINVVKIIIITKDRTTISVKTDDKWNLYISTKQFYSEIASQKK